MGGERLVHRINMILPASRDEILQLAPSGIDLSKDGIKRWVELSVRRLGRILLPLGPDVDAEGFFNIHDVTDPLPDKVVLCIYSKDKVKLAAFKSQLGKVDFKPSLTKKKAIDAGYKTTEECLQEVSRSVYKNSRSGLKNSAISDSQIWDTQNMIHASKRTSYSGRPKTADDKKQNPSDSTLREQLLAYRQGSVKNLHCIENTNMSSSELLHNQSNYSDDLEPRKQCKRKRGSRKNCRHKRNMEEEPTIPESSKGDSHNKNRLDQNREPREPIFIEPEWKKEKRIRERSQNREIVGTYQSHSRNAENFEEERNTERKHRNKIKDRNDNKCPEGTYDRNKCKGNEKVIHVDSFSDSSELEFYVYNSAENCTVPENRVIVRNLKIRPSQKESESENKSLSRNDYQKSYQNNTIDDSECTPVTTMCSSQDNGHQQYKLSKNYSPQANRLGRQEYENQLDVKHQKMAIRQNQAKKDRQYCNSDEIYPTKQRKTIFQDMAYSDGNGFNCRQKTNQPVDAKYIRDKNERTTRKNRNDTNTSQAVSNEEYYVLDGLDPRFLQLNPTVKTRNGADELNASRSYDIRRNQNEMKNSFENSRGRQRERMQEPVQPNDPEKYIKKCVRKPTTYDDKYQCDNVNRNYTRQQVVGGYCPKPNVVNNQNKYRPKETRGAPYGSKPARGKSVPPKKKDVDCYSDFPQKQVSSESLVQRDETDGYMPYEGHHEVIIDQRCALSKRHHYLPDKDYCMQQGMRPERNRPKTQCDHNESPRRPERFNDKNKYYKSRMNNYGGEKGLRKRNFESRDDSNEIMINEDDDELLVDPSELPRVGSNLENYSSDSVGQVWERQKSMAMRNGYR